MTKSLAWGRKVSPLFRQILAEGCRGMYWDENGASRLMACMAWESDETFSPSIKNPLSSATGLIQFMRSTALSMGTTVEALARMMPEEQLRWVFKYFDRQSRMKGPGKPLSDYYMAILMPSFVGRPDSSVVIHAPAQYKVNKGLDLNRDGVITKSEATEKVRQKLTKGLLYPYVYP